MVFDPIDEISNSNAHKIIREIVTGGTIIISSHAKERMIERKYTAHDVEYILLNGEITKKEFNTKAQNWAYTIKGKDMEGDDAGVVAAIVRGMSAVVITVLS